MTKGKRMQPSITPMDARMLKALVDLGGPACGSTIARQAELRTSSVKETAARHCIRLVKAGLAEKRGTRMFPEWVASDAGRHYHEQLQSDTNPA